jgi:hypothetical protein
MRVPFGSRRWFGLTAALVVACCGCASVPEAEQRDESFTEASQYERKPDKPSLPFAVSERGREIEKDFGVRR